MSAKRLPDHVRMSQFLSTNAGKEHWSEERPRVAGPSTHTRHASAIALTRSESSFPAPIDLTESSEIQVEYAELDVHCA